MPFLSSSRIIRSIIYIIYTNITIVICISYSVLFATARLATLYNTAIIIYTYIYAWFVK